MYRASDFTVRGEPIDAPPNTTRLGAGNLFDGGNPDLRYSPANGRVQIDLSDLAAQYPITSPSGNFQWEFDTERLFFSLANHDQSFSTSDVATGVAEGLGRSFPAPIANKNRVGLTSASLRSWNGALLDLGELFPRGMRDPGELRRFLAAAHFSTDRQSGQFDLLVVAVPEPCAPALGITAVLAAAWRRRRR